MITLVLSTVAQAQAQTDTASQSDWWFDIELIVFKHAVDGSQLVEQFDNAIVPIDLRNSQDLILNHLYPNTRRLQRSLVECYRDPNDQIFLPPQTAAAFTINDTLYQRVAPDDPTPESNAAFPFNSASNSEIPQTNAFLTNRRDVETGTNRPANRSLAGIAIQGATSQSTTSQRTGSSLNTDSQRDIAGSNNNAQNRRTANHATHSPPTLNASTERPPTEEELANIQMAFSMPGESNAEPAQEVETDRLNQNEGATANIGNIANAENTVSTVSSEPTENIDSIDNIESIGNTENTESIANTNSTQINASNVTVEDTSPAITYAPMSLTTNRKKLALLDVEVPQNLGCRFAEEPLFGLEPNQKHKFAQWLSEQIVSVSAVRPSEINTDSSFADTTSAPEASNASPRTTTYPEQLPLRYNVLNRSDTQSAYLLPPSALRLRKMSRAINRRRGISTVSHIAWRQHVPFGRENAEDFRVVAGKNYSEEFGYEGYPRLKNEEIEKTMSASPFSSAFENALSENALSENMPPVNNLLPHSPDNHSDDNADIANLFQDITAALAELDKTPLTGSASNSAANTNINTNANAVTEQNNTLSVPQVAPELLPEQVWELDGLFKVYLQYIGRVPYLHIDSKFNFRQPMIMEAQQFPESFQTALNNELTAGDIQYFLKPYHFQQLRRVVSRQIHYFDHPMFGVVVQIRRYQIPDYIR